MSPYPVDPQLLDALNRASTLQLFKLSSLIKHLLADPQRVIAVRLNMAPGHTVRFIDDCEGHLCEGRVLFMSETQVTLQDLTEPREWTLPYTAVEPLRQNSAPRAVPLPQPMNPVCEEFRRGQRVSFEDKYLKTMVGTIEQINACTASVASDHGTRWRVSFSLLSHVNDV